ncbi:MAG: hypothetical protein ACOY4I_13880 [Bacillota bacterium]
MARILFLPVLLVILALVAILVFKIRSMFSLSKSKDIVLFRPAPFGAEVRELLDNMLTSLGNLSNIQFRSEILVNFRKIISLTRTGSGNGHCKITWKSTEFEISREAEAIIVKTAKTSQISIPRENRWIDFWSGTGTLEESIKLFGESGMKIMGGNVGIYQERKYTEILVISHSMPREASKAFETCYSPMEKVFGKNLSEPGIVIRNFMVRILVNDLTCMPDYIETKFHVFREDEFISDYMQNARLLY